MLIPIADENAGRHTTPVVVYVVIAINIIIFLFLQQAGRKSSAGEEFTYGYAVVPREIVTGRDLTEPLVAADAPPVVDPRTGRRETPVIPEAPGPDPIYLTLLTAMFMHGGWLHLIGNMLYLWIFGDNIEDNFGHIRFAVFYVLSGLLASFAHIMADPESVIPSLGASGAIAGVLGSYLIMFPRNRVRNLIFFGLFFTTVELPAIIVLGFWIVLQFLNQYTASFEHAGGGGVAYMAHIGGFIAGVVLCFVFRNRRRSNSVSYQ